jgi:diguanylate cyclase (GGDEF)-like protein
MLSLTDVLTGLYNRRGFFVQAEHLFKVARRKRARSAVIFADIDGLKQINDELGHDSGDSAIRDAGAVFRQSFRQADVVSRIGGDEFVAYTLDDEQPDVILARIRANLRAFNLMQERTYAVSMSAGIVQCDPIGEQPLADYLLLADEQMYAQKRSRLH